MKFAIRSKALGFILGLATALSYAPLVSAAEKGDHTGQSGSGSGATGQSADGEKDVRDVGEAGGGGQASGNMPPPESTGQPPAESPNSKQDPVQSQ